jgi:hypothetical protein
VSLPFRHLVATACLVAVTGCAASGGQDAAATTSLSTTTSEFTGDGAPPEDLGPDGGTGTAGCPSASAVGQVLGTEVDRAIHISFNLTGMLSTSTDGCSYRPSEGAGEAVTISRISRNPFDDEPTSGRLFDAIERAAIEELDIWGFGSIDGADDAYLAGRKVVVRSDRAMWFVAHEPADGPDPGSENPALDVFEDLIALDLAGDERPDCDAIAAVVADQVGPVIDTVPSGGFVGVDDVSITTSGCRLELADGAELVVDVAPGDAFDDWVQAKEGSSFATSFEPLEVAGRRAFSTGDELVVDDSSSGEDDSPFEIVVPAGTLSATAHRELQVALAELAIGD